MLAQPEVLDARTQQLWDRHWRVYAQRCAEFEGEYLCSPAYDDRFPSSSGVTVRQAREKLNKKVKVKRSGIVQNRTVRMPAEEAEALALPLPFLAPGHYGRLASVEVAEVLGPRSMVVEDIQLVDTEKLSEAYKADRTKARESDQEDEAIELLEHRYQHRIALAKRQKKRSFKGKGVRIEGFSTLGLIEGERWLGPKDQGLHVVIVKVEAYGSERRPRERLVAVALDKISWGLEEPQFIDLITQRGFDQASFVDLVLERMAEADPQTARTEVGHALLPPEPGESEEDEDADAEKADPPTDDEGDTGDEAVDGPGAG